jgi:hypothetical protein
MKIHSHILQGSEATEEAAIEHAQSYDFSEDDEPQEHKFDWQHHQYIETTNNIDIYYNSTADYYFFTAA